MKPAVRLSIAQRAAVQLDLSSARRLVCVGEPGDLPAAFRDAWPHLSVRCIGAPCDVAAGDLVVVNAIGPDTARRFVDDLRPGWLPAAARLLIVGCEPGPLHGAPDRSWMHACGLRRVGAWPLGEGASLLVCAAADNLLDALVRP